jgi:hypothetical protein
MAGNLHVRNLDDDLIARLKRRRDLRAVRPVDARFRFHGLSETWQRLTGAYSPGAYLAF